MAQEIAAIFRQHFKEKFNHDNKRYAVECTLHVN